MTERIKFGSLEGLAAKGDSAGDGKDSGSTAGPGKVVEVMAFSQETMLSKEKHEEQLRKFQLEMRARTIAAPTHDHDVKMQLRKFEEPICLFGEGPAERRDRLKKILAKMEVEKGISAAEVVAASSRQGRGGEPTAEDLKREVFYTEGTEDLRRARLWILQYSLPRAQRRVTNAKRRQAELDRYIAIKQAKMAEAADAAAAASKGAAAAAAAAASSTPAAAPAAAAAAASSGGDDGGAVTAMDEDNEVEQEHMTFIDKAGTYRNMDLASSQIGDVRPIAAVAFSPDDGRCLATASWSGVAKLWSVPECSALGTLAAHRERLTDVKFHPGFSASLVQPQTAAGDSMSDGAAAGADTVGLATASADRTVKLWSAGRLQPLETLAGHADRLCRIAFHPSGRFLGTTSYDRTWRLWDLEAGGREILCQEGHSRAVYAIAFQADGALAVTAGLDAVGRVWDLRSGRSVVTLQGHVKQILGVDFDRGGSRVATGSDDNTVRLWDLRKKKAFYTIPAHTRLVSAVRFSACGDFLFSSSYDRTCKVWNLRNCTAVKTLAGHDDKVMGVDVAPGGDYIATASYDRTFKLWVPGSWHD